LPFPVCKDETSSIVDSNIIQKTSGLASDVEIAHPVYILFEDKTGCNPNKKKDDSFGGHMYLADRGEIPEEMLSSQECHLTVM
jgi:hypothetical protein